MHHGMARIQVSYGHGYSTILSAVRYGTLVVTVKARLRPGLVKMTIILPYIDLRGSIIALFHARRTPNATFIHSPSRERTVRLLEHAVVSEGQRLKVLLLEDGGRDSTADDKRLLDHVPHAADPWLAGFVRSRRATAIGRLNGAWLRFGALILLVLLRPAFFYFGKIRSNHTQLMI